MNEAKLIEQPTDDGLFVEHVLLSVTIVSDRKGAGQFDDSCAYTLQKNIGEYHGVKAVIADVLYKHTKIETHAKDCACHFCAYAPKGSQ